jgi:hypothetical protein
MRASTGRVGTLSAEESRTFWDAVAFAHEAARDAGHGDDSQQRACHGAGTAGARLFGFPATAASRRTLGEKLAHFRASRRGRTRHRGSGAARDVAVCSPDDSVSTVEKLMTARQIRRVPVVDWMGELVGVITLGDLSRHAQSSVLSRAVEGAGVTRTMAAVCAPRPPAGRA